MFPTIADSEFLVTLADTAKAAVNTFVPPSKIAFTDTFFSSSNVEMSNWPRYSFQGMYKYAMLFFSVAFLDVKRSRVVSNIFPVVYKNGYHN